MARLALLTLFCLQAISIVTAIQCNRRSYGHGSHVCVCSEQLHCDDMDVKPSQQSGTISSYTTSRDGDRFAHRELKFTKETHAASGHNHFEVGVNRSHHYQKIIGFGGTLTDASAIMISKLPKSLQERLIRDFYSDAGLGHTLTRVPIGATDASTRGYTLDDHSHDDSLSQFALVHEDNLRILQLEMAHKVSHHGIKLFASAWSSPAWMKTNNRLINGGTLLGHPGEKYYKLFAKYLVRFLDEYNKHHTPMWGLTVLNEPLVCNDPHWPWSCLSMSGTQQRDFIKHDLGPELRSSAFKNVKLMSYDFNLPDIVSFNTPILTDHESAKYVDGVAYHWYFNEKNYDKLETMAKNFPDKFLISTESGQGHAGEPKVWLGDWGTFNHCADDLIRVLNLHTTGWVDWSMVNDLQGGPNYVKNFGEAPVIVNETSHEYYKQPFFYALGHFSKFIVPDSVRVQHHSKASEHPENLLVTVFERPDHGTVVTILNKNTHPVSIQLHDPKHGYMVTDVKAEALESLIYY